MNIQSVLQRIGLVAIYGVPGALAVLTGFALSGDAGWITIPFWFWGAFVAAGAVALTACFATSTAVQWPARIATVLLLLVLLGGMTKDESWATWSSVAQRGFLAAALTSIGMFLWFTHVRRRPWHWALLVGWLGLTALWYGLSWPMAYDTDWLGWLHPTTLTRWTPALLAVLAWLASPSMLHARLWPGGQTGHTTASADP